MADVLANAQANALANERLAAIVDSSFDAIIGKNLDSIITDWNFAAEKLFGYTAEEAIGQSVRMLIPDGLQAEETEIIERVRRGERVPSYDTTRRRKDGTYISVSLTVSPIRDLNGVIIGASKIARDITAAKESEHRIHMLLREVNHRVKNQFSVILSVIGETSRRSQSPREFEAQVRDRIMALSRSHDLIVASEWSGASIVDLIQEQLKPFGHEEHITLAGPLVTLQPNAVQHLGMAFHELGNNSVRHGALGKEGGTVAIKWLIDSSVEGRRQLHVDWEEKSPATSVSETRSDGTRDGFSNVVLQRVTPQSLGGSSVLTSQPGHLSWSLVTPVDTTLVVPLNEQPLMPAKYQTSEA